MYIYFDMIIGHSEKTYDDYIDDDDVYIHNKQNLVHNELLHYVSEYNFLISIEMASDS